MENVDNAVKAIRALAKDVDYTTSPTIASTLLSILNAHRINADNLPVLLEVLDQVQRPLTVTEKVGSLFQNGDGAMQPKKPTLANWFFRLSHPSNTDSGKELRQWLIANKISATEIRLYYDYNAQDLADFSAGFVLGVAKSLTYDNVKGLYDLLGLTVNIHFLITNYEADLLERLAMEYREKRNTNLALAVQSVGRLQQSLLEYVLHGKGAIGYKEANAVGGFLSEIKTLLLDFCMSPFINFVHDEVLSKFDLLADRLNTFVSKETAEYRKAASIKDYANAKFENAVAERVYPLLMQYRMFEAGVAAGNLLTDIAQMLAGIVMLLFGAGKLVLKGGKIAVAKLMALPVASKAKAMVMLSAITIDVNTLSRMPLMPIDSPAIVLALETNEIKQVSNALMQEAAFIETSNVKMLDADVANELSQSMGKPLGLGCSSMGGDPSYVAALLALLTLRVRRRKGGALLEDEIKVIKGRFTNDFANQYVKRIANAKRPNFDRYLKGIADDVSIIMPSGASEEKMISMMVEAFVKQFIADVGRGKIKVKKKGVYSSFNSYMNKRLRAIRKMHNFEGSVLIIDERLDTLLTTTIDKNSLTRWNNVSMKMEDVFKMTIEEFYQTFYKEKQMSEMYRGFVKKIKATDARPLYEKRQKLLALIESGKGDTETLLKEYEAVTEEITDKVQALITARKITASESDKIMLRTFGKLNLEGTVGAARPDFAMVDLVDGVKVYDFLHASSLDAADASHLIGSQFYLDFFRVVFGDIAPERSVAKDILYTFGETFKKSLK